MKLGFYPRLAMDGIRKNRRLYFPYLLTCVLMIAIFYILLFLSLNPYVESMKGGGVLQSMMALGSIVIGFFSVIFLIYTNAFLIRRRKKEFGLYNILGMSKHNIGWILFWESLISGCIFLLAGLFFGVLLSKLAELGLANLLQNEISLSFSVSFTALRWTATLFLVIDLVIFLNSLRQIRFSSASELVKSENFGEKPPKANFLLGFSGVIILAGAYYIALSVQNPIDALIWFFVAVLMVIAATYLLFISGSVLLCRILQKKKSYYYKKNHFVSVASMIYRMKRNGAGLASICILATMVLVMISSSASLYLGAESSIRTRYPREVNLSVDFYPSSHATPEAIEGLEEAIVSMFPTDQVKNAYSYWEAHTYGLLEGEEFHPDPESMQDFNTSTYDKLICLNILDIEDYNRMTGETISLAPGTALAYGEEVKDIPNVLRYREMELTLIPAPQSLDLNGINSVDTVRRLFIVVPNLSETTGYFESAFKGNEDLEIRTCWLYGCDPDFTTEDEYSLAEALGNAISNVFQEIPVYCYSFELRSAERGEFYSLFGGLFFLGILLSIVFLIAAVLIIFYKQISEGYEDQDRFDIMQKVGMTKKDIRKSINSQMLTVFFAPLVGASMHLCFALPMIKKLLMLFAHNDVSLLLGVSALCVAVFGLFYAIVYKLTSNAYFSIVSSKTV